MKLSLSLIFLLFSIALNAQTSITGRIVEQETQEPLEFAEVVLRSDHTSDLLGVITNSNGIFNIEVASGQYEFQVVYVGQVLYKKDLSVTDKDIDLGTIKTNNSRKLDEILVVAKKKLIQQKIDRLVFNVANSSKSSQGDVVELLKITPGVRVENGNITMIGKGGLQVMIDGKIIRLSGLDLINFLSSIPSENIDRIEVINNPPAKYEASGNSGLINIVLKKAKNDSWNAFLKGTYLQRFYPTWRATGIFNYKKDKLSVATRFAYSHQFVHFVNEGISEFPDALWQTETPVDIETEGYLATADLSYEISKNWEMGGQYYYNATQVGVDVKPSTRILDYDTGEEIRTISSDGYEPQHPRMHVVNFNNRIDLDSLGKKVILNLDYFYDYNPLNARYYDGVSNDLESNSTQYFKTVSLYTRDVKNYSAKIDVEYPLEWIDLDFGGKLSYLRSQNDISFFNSGLRDEPVLETPLENTEFDYRENISALYISANRNFGDKWSAQFGLRMEDTRINASSENSDLFRDNDYTNLFPTFYLSYEATSNSNFSLNYSRRIERPSFFDLNPNQYYQDPFQAYSGNPYLQSAFIDNVELSSIYRNFVTKLYYSYEDNLFAEVSLPDASSNITLVTTKNYINRSRFGLSENYTFDEIDWWTSNLNLNINYSKSNFDLESDISSQEGFNSFLSTTNDFNLNKEKTILAGLNYWYSFPGVDGIFKTKAASSLGVSLQFLLLEKDLSISLRGNDLFRTALRQRTTNINGVYQKLNNYNDTRQFWLILTYKFGNQNIETRKNEAGNKEEQDRL